MYRILDNIKEKTYLDAWATVTGDFDQIKGYSELGDIFLINSKTNEVGILLTMANAFHPMGYFDWGKFEKEIIENTNFQEDVLHKSLIEEIRNHCGKLSNDQVYIATPFPCIGGSGAPETYKKGDLWVYLALSSQTFQQI